jgi:hypothetical protein
MWSSKSDKLVYLHMVASLYKGSGYETTLGDSNYVNTSSCTLTKDGVVQNRETDQVSLRSYVSKERRDLCCTDFDAFHISCMVHHIIHHVYKVLNRLAVVINPV